MNFDVVVVGSGAGGACVAARMAESGSKVLLIEKGGRARPQADAMAAVAGYYSDAGFTTAFGNVLLPIPTGRTVGGTTTINSATCLSTPPAMLKRWEGESGGRFSAKEFSTYIEEARSILKVKPAPERTLSVSSRLIMMGNHAAAPLERCEDGCSGEGRCCFVCPSDTKMTSEKAFLNPQASNPNLELWTETAFISFEEGKPVRVKIRRMGETLTLECGTLVIAAGTLASPYFIRGAGKGLSVHPAAKIFAEFDEPVRGWEGVPQGVGFEDSADESIRYEGVYTPPELAAMTMPLEGSQLREWMERYDHVATFGFMIRDSMRGSVSYPAGPARPFIRYDMSEHDVRRMGAGMKRVAEVFFAAGAKRVVIPLNRPGNVLESKGDLGTFDPDSIKPLELQMMAFHPLGTCGMGRVVDHNLRAAEGVYVCDGSVVPESLGVNPQITIYAFALRLAAHLSAGGAS